MFTASCASCKRIHRFDESRVPPSGMLTKCTACGAQMVVMPPSGGGDIGGPPALVEKDASKSPKGRTLPTSDIVDLPAPKGPSPPEIPDLPAPVGPVPTKGITDLPAPVGPVPTRGITDLPTPVGPVPTKGI